MSRLVQLQDIRSQCREQADQETTDEANAFIDDAELNGYINNSIAELYDLIITVNGDEYFATSDTFTTSNGVKAYALPSDFYRLSGVDALVGGFTYAVMLYQFSERNRYQNLTAPGWYRGARIYYRLRKDDIVFEPQPDGSYTITLWYIPNPTILTLDTDTFDFYGGWEQWVIWDVVVKMLEKEESDASVAMANRMKQEARIIAAAPERDNGMPDRISDNARQGAWYGGYGGWLY